MSEDDDPDTFEVDFRQMGGDFTPDLVLQWLDGDGKDYVLCWKKVYLIGLDSGHANILQIMMPYFAKCEKVAHIIIENASVDVINDVICFMQLYGETCETIKFRRCDFTDDDCARICNELQSFERLEQFDMCVGAAGIITALAMASLILKKKTLKKLIPNALQFDNDCYATLFEALIESPHVQCFHSLVSFCSHRDYDPRLPTLLTRLFSGDTKLSEFVLGDFRCNDAECKTLFAALAGKNTLTHFSLVFSEHMTQARANGIALLLSSNQNLKIVAFGRTEKYQAGKEYFRTLEKERQRETEAAAAADQCTSACCCSSSSSTENNTVQENENERMKEYWQQEQERRKKHEEYLQGWESCSESVDLTAIEKAFENNRKLLCNGFLSDGVCKITESRWKRNNKKK